MVELINPGRIVDVMILTGTHNVYRSSMGSNAGMLAYCSAAKILARGTDRLHYTGEHKNTVSHG